MLHLVVIEIDFTRVAESHALSFPDSPIGQLPGGCVVSPVAYPYFTTLNTQHADALQHRTFVSNETCSSIGKARSFSPCPPFPERCGKTIANAALAVDADSVNFNGPGPRVSKFVCRSWAEDCVDGGW